MRTVTRHPDRTRRLIIKNAAASAVFGLGLGARLRGAQAAADAAKWPKDAFAQKTEADAIGAMGPAVSKDPYVKFSFKGAQKGDDLMVSWVDNNGASDSLVAKIQ
jgi:hypothetical protein